MKRTLLSLVALLAANIMVAQVCVPNVVEEEPFGIWPAPEEGFAVGTEGEFYTQVVSFKIPDDPSEIPGFENITFGNIDSVQVTDIVGLPDGLDWACESHSGATCTFYPNTPGCAIITGVPTESGVFPLSILVNGYVDLLQGDPTAIPFDEFEIEIEGSVSVAELAQYGMKLNQNVPNPFDEQTFIEFSLNQNIEVEFNVYDLVGKVVHTRTVNAVAGENRIDLNASALNLNSGIYLYSLGIDGQNVTRRMIVK